MFIIVPILNYLNFKKLKLPPYHLIHRSGVALYDTYDFRADILVDIVWNGDSGVAVLNKAYSKIDTLKEAYGINAAENKTALVKRLGTLSARTDAHSREGMPDRGKERTLLRERTTIRYHRKSVHLQTIVVVESQRLMLNHAFVKLEP
jgi:hypothetical protein